MLKHFLEKVQRTYHFIINFTFVFTPYVLEPHALGLMTSWKFTNYGLFNKCAVCTCSGRSVRDQQPDFPKDNATGSLLPPSVALAFLLDSTYSAMGDTKVEWDFLFHASSWLQESTAMKLSISWGVQPLPQCQDSLKKKMGVPCLCYEVQGQKVEWAQYPGNNNKSSNMDGQKLGWKNKWELGNSSQVGQKKVSVLDDRDRHVLNSPKP